VGVTQEVMPLVAEAYTEALAAHLQIRHEDYRSQPDVCRSASRRCSGVELPGAKCGPKLGKQLVRALARDLFYSLQSIGFII